MLLQSFGSQQVNRVALAQQVFILTCLYNDRRDLVEQYIGPDASIVIWERNRDTWPPSWVYIRQGEHHFIAIEGSTNIAQFAGHLNGVFQRLDFVGDASVNGAWWIVAEDFRKRLPSQQQGVWHYSGHSYGGALAGIMATDHAERRGNQAGVECMTFGAPAYMTTGYDGPYPDPYWRCESLGDLVPNLPPNGVELLGMRWRNPLEWLKRDWFYWQYGNPVYFNYQGDDTLSLGDVNDRGELVGVGMPSTHEIPNYWGRQNWWAQRNDPNNETLKTALEFGKSALYGGSPQIEVMNLPSVFVGPSGNLEVIPILWQSGFSFLSGGSNVIKVDLVFLGKNNSTWRESHYTTDATAEAAAQRFGNEEVLSRRAAMLSSLYNISHIEAVEVGADKPGYPKEVQIKGVGPSTAAAETTGSVLHVGIYNAANKIRWCMMRGFSDQQIGFDPTTGNTFVSKATSESIAAWVSALKTLGAGWVTRVPRTADQPVTQPNEVLSLNGNTYPGMTVVTCVREISAPENLLSFHRFDKRKLPGLNGLRKVIDVDGTTCRIPYTMPYAGIVQPGDGAYVRTYQTSSFNSYTTSWKRGRVFSKRTKVCCV